MGPGDHLGQHWENKHLRNVNVRLLEAAGGAWDAPPSGDKLAGTRVKGLSKLASERISQTFGTADIAVWKDPRTCLTLPFWRPLIGHDPIVVLIHRHPYEVARSLESRNRFGHGLSFALWERYNADVLRFADGLPTTVLKYTDIVGRSREVMTELVKQLSDCGVDLPNDPATTDMELQPSARHHVSDSDDVLDHPVATASQRVLFDLLVSLDGQHANFQRPAELPVPHPLSTELVRAANKFRRVRERLHVARGRADAAGSPTAETNPTT